MKHMKWLALLTAIVMVLGMGAAMGEYTFGEFSAYNGPDHSMAGSIAWLQVPWEDKGINVWFGLHATTREAAEKISNHLIEIDILSQTGNASVWNTLESRLNPFSIDQSSQMRLDINLRDDDKEDPATGLGLQMYIQVTPPWQGKTSRLNFMYIGENKNEKFNSALLTDPYAGTSERADGDYLKIDMQHFSNFIVYAEADPVAAPVAPPSGSVPSTGDQSAPAMWLALAAMSAAVVIGFGRKARKA